MSVAPGHCLPLLPSFPCPKMSEEDGFRSSRLDEWLAAILASQLTADMRLTNGRTNILQGQYSSDRDDESLDALLVLAPGLPINMQPKSMVVGPCSPLIVRLAFTSIGPIF